MTATHRGRFSAAYIAVGIAGFASFVNLYAPQALLPLLSAEFGASVAAIGQIMTVSTLAMALTAPFTGAMADVLGRKRVIVVAMLLIGLPTLMCALAPSLHALIVWRFVGGLLLPAVFAVAVAYVGDEFEPREAVHAAGIYMMGASLGGFSGRFFTGIMADMIGWRGGFMIVAASTVVCAIATWILLPRETKFVRSDGLIASGKQMLQHFRNRQLVATYAVGFGVLYCFICTFTYINFRLAAAPYNLSASWLGAIFVTFLGGTFAAPHVGRWVARFGQRKLMLVALACWSGAVLLTLAAPLWLILIGLTLCAGCGLVCQTTSFSYVAITAKAGRSSAVGLYVASFYIGGSVGAALGGVAWVFGGWPACVATLIAMIAIMAGIVYSQWARGH